ncbi:MAG TPA: dihydrodipicolinate synthase family protein [Armatimonadaceae bacterium]|nr:dihydrodipicolinate synthase family protein [Armatimonadaceae bacterium]
MTHAARFITALVTPLDEQDRLHREGLERAVQLQLDADIDGLLIAGSMGAMQLLPDATYRDLVAASAELLAGRVELLIGAGDASLSRTAERVEFLNRFPLDGVVILAPYLMPFSQAELLDYFRALADLSRAPLFLYDLPQMTRTKIERDTALALARHPNIAGIKCSDEPGYARQLRDLADERFRVILAAPTVLDVFLRSGFLEHLDGVFTLCPARVVELGRAVERGDAAGAAALQQGLNRTLALLHRHGVWNPFTELLHALGVPGRFKPRPHAHWDAATAEAFLADPETRAVLAFLRGEPAAADAARASERA